MTMILERSSPSVEVLPEQEFHLSGSRSEAQKGADQERRSDPVGGSNQPRISPEIEWDSQVRGLGIRRRKTSTKPTWVVQWRVNGKTGRRSLGPVASMPPETARALAREMIRQRHEGGASEPPTVAQFASRFIEDCAHRWKPGSLYNARRMVKKIIVPQLGHRRIDQLNRVDVLSWHDALKVSRTWALSTLSSMLGHAELLGYRQGNSNPCTGLRKKQRRFTAAKYPGPDAYRRLSAVLSALPDEQQHIAQIIRFLALTGARRGEAIGARWEYLHGDQMVLPDSKTGPKSIWLPAAVLALLGRVKRHPDNPWIFSKKGRTAFTQELSLAWYDIRSAAGLHGLRLHDLRHGYAAAAVSQGHDLKTVGRLLGHTDFATTLGYAHLSQRHVAEAAQRVSGRLGAALLSSSASHSHGPHPPPTSLENPTPFPDQPTPHARTPSSNSTAPTRCCDPSAARVCQHDVASNHSPDRLEKANDRGRAGGRSEDRFAWANCSVGRQEASPPPHPTTSGSAPASSIQQAVKQYYKLRQQGSPREFCALHGLNFHEFRRALNAHRRRAKGSRATTRRNTR